MIAYIDASCIVAIALGEPNAKSVAMRIRGFSTLLSHPLLNAEVRSACVREGRPTPEVELGLVQWIDADRPLSGEIDLALSTGYLRGADCLHVATALYLSPDTRQLT